MEALAAFSVACNVLQVITIAGNAASLVLQVYKQGTSVDNIELARTSNHLSSVTKALELSLAVTSTSRSSKNAGNGTLAELEVRQLAIQCSATAAELQTELAKLSTTTGGGRREALAKSWKAFRKRSDLSKLQTKLENYQKLLDTGLLVRLSEQNNASEQLQQTAFNELDGKLQTFIKELAKTQSTVVDHINIDSNGTQLLVTSESQKTRDHLDTQLQNLKLEGITEAQRSTFTQSLRYPEMFSRLNHVPQTSVDTFEWIIDGEESTNKDVSFPDFIQWLQKGTGIYWVQGKPGSGKSTLMKFICEHPNTNICAAFGKNDQNAVSLSHFFWLAGSAHQKNLHGLLCSLLYQVVDWSLYEVDDMLQHDPSLRKKRSSDDWNSKELQRLLLKILHRQPPTMIYCIFIDGLDECSGEGTLAMLFDLIQELRSCSAVKLCVSSRPEPQILRSLRAENVLRLHEVTHDDICSYAEAEIEQIVRQVRPEIDGDNLNVLLKTIISKSEGVFLWVRLAMEDLRRGLANLDSYDQLEDRIKRLPQDIHKLYQNMLERLGEDWQLYRDEAALYLKMCYLADPSSFTSGPIFDEMETFPPRLSLVTMAFIQMQNEPNSPPFLTHPNHVPELLRRCERIKSRIAACCGGMLDVNVVEDDFLDNTPDSPHKDSYLLSHCHTVSFTHRSVLDFLESPDGSNLLGSCKAREDILYAGSLRATITYFMAWKPNSPDWLFYLMHWWRTMSFSPDIWSSVNLWAVELFAQAFESLCMQLQPGSNLAQWQLSEYATFRQYPYMFYRQMGQTDMTGFLLARGLYEAVLEHPNSCHGRKMERVPSLTTTYASYLLYSAAQNSHSREALWWPLLEAGADLNEEIALPIDRPFLTTPWLQLINSLRYLDATTSIGRIVESCLDRGADLDGKVLIFYLVDRFGLPWTQRFAFFDDHVIHDWLGVAVIMVGEVKFVLRRVLESHMSGEHVRDVLEFLDSNPDSELHPCFLIRKDSTEDRVTKAYRIPPESLPMVTKFVWARSDTDGDDRMLHENPGADATEIENMCTPENKISLDDQLREQGYIVNQDHPAVPTQPYQRFVDPKDETMQDSILSKVFPAGMTLGSPGSDYRRSHDRHMWPKVG